MAVLETEIRPSCVDELLAKAGSLIAEHGQEVDGAPPKPHHLRYLALEQHGALTILAAWDGGEIVGYSVLSVSLDLNREDVTIAHCNAIFVLPSHRRGGLGHRLMGETIAAAKAQGATEFYCHAAPGTAMDHLLSARRWQLHQNLYRRAI